MLTMNIENKAEKKIGGDDDDDDLMMKTTNKCLSQKRMGKN